MTRRGLVRDGNGLFDDGLELGLANGDGVGNAIKFFRHVNLDVGFAAVWAHTGGHGDGFNRNPVAPQHN